MYLTRRRLDLLGQIMAVLADSQGEREVRTRVGELMLDLLNADFYASYVWDDLQQCFHSGVRINMDPANLARYDDYYQFHDPVTFKLQRHRQAVRVSDVVPQAELVRTEFFNDFVKRDGLYWGSNLFAWSGQRNIGDLRIWRTRQRGDFTSADIQLLDLIRPALVAALLRGRREPGAVATAGMGVQPSLSVREREVAACIAAGLPDKAISHRLGISVTTVRTHIDRMFAKLEVKNRLALVRRLERLGVLNREDGKALPCGLR